MRGQWSLTTLAGSVAQLAGCGLTPQSRASRLVPDGKLAFWLRLSSRNAAISGASERAWQSGLVDVQPMPSEWPNLSNRSTAASVITVPGG
jgi:hypothetical protein